MADDIQNEMNALRNEFLNTASALGRFNSATVKNTGTTKGLDDMGKRAEKEVFEMVTGFDKIVDAGKEAIKALVSFQGKLADGNTSFSSLGDIVDGVSNAAGAFQNQLSKYGTLVDKNGKDTHKKVGMIGSAASMAAGVIQKYGPASKILLAEMDKQVAAYQELSKVGATTATGISGMQDMASRSGLPFQKFVGAIAANSEALAMMGGTAGQGAEKFAEMTETLAQGTDNSLRYIGMGSEQIAAAAGKYVDIQAKQGKLAGRTSAQLAKDSQDYLLKMKRLSMITGVSIDKLEDQEKEMAVDNQFQAFLSSLPPDQAEKATQLWREFNAKGMGKEAMSAMMGGITKSGQQFLNTMGTSILSFRNANQSVDGIVQQSVAAGVRQKDQIAQNQQYTDANESAYLAFTKILAVSNIDPAKQQKDADAAMDGMVNNTDEETKSTVEAQKAMEKQAILTQKAMFKLMPAFTQGVAGVTGSMETIEDEIVNLSDKIEQITGIKVPGMDEWRRDPMNAMKQTGEATAGYISTRAGQAYDATKQFFGFGGGGGKPSETFKEQAPTLMKNLMSDFKLTKEQAAGIVGNLGHESAGLQAGIQEKNPLGGGRGGLGWAQWTGPRRRAFEAYLQQTGQSATDPNANYGFLKQELMTTHKGALSAVRNTTDAHSAMMAFENQFEGASAAHKGYESRDRYTQQTLALMSNASTNTTPQTPQTTAQAPTQKTTTPTGLPEGKSFMDANKLAANDQAKAQATADATAKAQTAADRKTTEQRREEAKARLEAELAAEDENIKQREDIIAKMKAAKTTEEAQAYAKQYDALAGTTVAQQQSDAMSNQQTGMEDVKKTIESLKAQVTANLPPGVSFADASKAATMGTTMPQATPVTTPIAAPNNTPSGVTVTPPVAASNTMNNTGDPNADVPSIVRQINDSLKEVTVKVAALDNKTKDAAENMKKVKDKSQQTHA